MFQKPSFILLFTLFFSIPSFVSAFSDVSPSHSNAKAIDSLTQKGILNGYEDKSFRPEKFISRAGFTKIVISAVFLKEEISSCLSKTLRPHMTTTMFGDVKRDDWFAPYACLAYKKGIIQGFSDTTFRASDKISLSAAAKIMTQSFEWKAEKPLHPTLWYLPYIKLLRNKEILPKYLRNPSRNITRAETAEILWRMLKKQEDKKDLKKPTSAKKLPKKGRKINSTPQIKEKKCQRYKDCPQEIQKKMDDIFDVPTTPNRSLSHSKPFAIAEYVIKDRTLQLGKKIVRPQHNAIWQKILHLYPKKYLNQFDIFRIYSDGKGGITGEVFPTDFDTWGIAIDLSDKDDLPYTLLHELLHIIVISSGEHLLNRFENKFWKPYGDVFYDIAELPLSQQQDEIDNASEEYVDFFLTDYALTDPEEDLAESFAHFVLLEKPKDDFIADQKILFFYGSPDMVHLRELLRWVLFTEF